MRKIDEVSVLDLLPINLRNNPDIKAASKAVDGAFFNTLKEVPKILSTSKIDEIEDEELLELLAWENHVDFWDSSLSIKQKQEIIEASNDVHMKKGTAGIVREMASKVFGRTILKEWFEYGGDPFHFMINIDVTERGASQADIKLLERLIQAYKNERSRLEKINIYLTSKGETRINASMNLGEEISVFPWFAKEAVSTGKISLSSRNQMVESVTAYPKEE